MLSKTMCRNYYQFWFFLKMSFLVFKANHVTFKISTVTLVEILVKMQRWIGTVQTISFSFIYWYISLEFRGKSSKNHYIIAIHSWNTFVPRKTRSSIFVHRLHWTHNVFTLDSSLYQYSASIDKFSALLVTRSLHQHY